MQNISHDYLDSAAMKRLAYFEDLVDSSLISRSFFSQSIIEKPDPRCLASFFSCFESTILYRNFQ